MEGKGLEQEWSGAEFRFESRGRFWCEVWSSQEQLSINF
jgi:hypothetical protein